MRIRVQIWALCLAVTAASCGAPADVVYFQDLSGQQSVDLKYDNGISLRSGDQLSIIVNSKDPMLADLFNLPISTHRVGDPPSTTLAAGLQVSLYTVDSAGEIDFPVLGKIKIAGMNREQVAAHIKEALISRNLVNDPVVTVEYANLSYSVLGEVNRPGRYGILREKMSLLEGLSQAGDLTILGRRQNVRVIRQEGGQSVTYTVDLTSANDLYSSPVFYLQQEDIIYVEPNDYRIRQAHINANTVRSTAFWLSVTSLVSTFVLFFLK